MSTSNEGRGGRDAPITLSEEPQRALGLGDCLGLWGNLGISLLLPVAATFVVLAGQPLASTVLAIVVGALIGSVLLGLGAAAGAREGVPAMVLMRGLLGRRTSYLPTAVNLVQCLGWATFEIVIIAEAASRALDAPRWPFVLGAGALATLLAIRPLGAVRLLARYAVWAALAAGIYLFVQVLSQPLPTPTDGGASSFWTATDIVIALPISWFPLAADYTRHARGARSAFAGAAIGYGAATIALFTLGVLALAAYGAAGLDVIDALFAVPFGCSPFWSCSSSRWTKHSPTSTPPRCRRRTSPPASIGGCWPRSSGRWRRCWRWASTSPPTSRSCS